MFTSGYVNTVTILHFFIANCALPGTTLLSGTRGSSKNLLMPSDGVVAGEAQFAKEAGLPRGLPRWFSPRRSECVRGPSETFKLEIFEANCSFASVSRGRLSL